MKSVKTTHEEKTKQLEEQIRSRLQSAAEKRENIEKELQEKLKEQVLHLQKMRKFLKQLTVCV